jgi:4-amino-4-deoxy-L-arabinose transferase-like glycosyltransferase
MALPGSFSSRETPVKPALQAWLGWHGLGGLMVLWALGICLGLGTASRLTYHEAFVAQGAREIVASGCWWHPAVGGLPWLEKPPLPFWLVAALGWCVGEITPTVARLPSAAATLGLALGIGLLAARRYGPAIGVLAGAVQVTTAWTILRGRLAEADILLACLITWALLAFDRLRASPEFLRQDPRHAHGLDRWKSWRWAFFGLLSLTSLVKGTGFGAALVLTVVAVVLAWDRDPATRRRLAFPAGWILTALVTMAWPVAMIAEHGFKVVGLWTMHVTQRLGSSAGHGLFAGESWREYGLNVLGQALPWTPLAVLGAGLSLGRILGDHRRSATRGGPRLLLDPLGGDRLLLAWAVAPLVLVSLTSARNAHYAIHAMIPWSVWAALGLANLGGRLTVRGWSRARLRRLAVGGFAGLAAACGLGHWLAGPSLDHRGREWAFYETTGRLLAPGEPLALLYDDWDREAYPTPFGAIPHDLAVRLYYLKRPACWHFDAASLGSAGVGPCLHQGPPGDRPSLAIVGRERDLPALEAMGRVEVIARSRGVRWDRTYLLARVWLSPEPPRTALRSEPSPQVAR